MDYLGNKCKRSQPSLTKEFINYIPLKQERGKNEDEELEDIDEGVGWEYDNKNIIEYNHNSHEKQPESIVYMTPNFAHLLSPKTSPSPPISNFLKLPPPLEDNSQMTMDKLKVSLINPSDPSLLLPSLSLQHNTNMSEIPQPEHNSESPNKFSSESLKESLQNSQKRSPGAKRNTWGGFDYLSPVPTPESKLVVSPIKGTLSTHYARFAFSDFGEQAIFQLIEKLHRKEDINKSLMHLARDKSLDCLSGYYEEIPKIEPFLDLKRIQKEERRENGMRYKILILDLDNTLIQTIKSQQALEYYTTKENKLKVCTTWNGIHFILRPFLLIFLMNMMQYYKIVVFTAAGSTYATSILNKIQELAGMKIFEYAYCLGHIIKVGDFVYAKRLIMDIKEKYQVVVDDRFDPWFHCPDNYIPILPFRGQSTDRALVPLGAYLSQLAAAQDVSLSNSKYINMKHKMDLFCSQNKHLQSKEEPSSLISPPEEIKAMVNSPTNSKFLLDSTTKFTTLQNE